MKYRTKIIEIDAFQITRETRADTKDWPEWLLKAFMLDPQAVGAVYPEELMQSDGKTDRLVLQGEHGRYAINFDDWILRGPYGDLIPSTDTDFRAIYEPVPGQDKAA